MTIDDKVTDEKLQYDINREIEKKKKLTLWSKKFDKYDYLTGRKSYLWSK